MSSGVKLDGVNSDGVPASIPAETALASAFPFVPLQVKGLSALVADHIASRAVISHTAIPDANYQALVTDVQIGFAALTAPRTVSLPDVDAYPLGQVLFIADESGQCSPTNVITIAPGPGTGDTIAGSAGITLQEPYLGIGFRRGAANVWIIAR